MVRKHKVNNWQLSVVNYEENPFFQDINKESSDFYVEILEHYMELKDKENQDRYERILEEVKKNLNMKDNESYLKTGLIKVGKRGF